MLEMVRVDDWVGSEPSCCPVLMTEPDGVLHLRVNCPTPLALHLKVVLAPLAWVVL